LGVAKLIFVGDMGLSQDFALDSQCFTYLITALEKVEEPTGPLAAQKKALFRSFLYSGASHFITPTVDKEWRQIPDKAKRKMHEIWNSVHIGTMRFWSAGQEAKVSARANEFVAIHPRMNDCLILAEAEVLGANKLITFDQRFLEQLAPISTIKMVTPEDHWLSMRIKPGTKPKVIPESSNPASRETWWRL
jgi:predicted nucleic-acid-binding protein